MSGGGQGSLEKICEMTRDGGGEGRRLQQKVCNKLETKLGDLIWRRGGGFQPTCLACSSSLDGDVGVFLEKACWCWRLG